MKQLKLLLLIVATPFGQLCLADDNDQLFIDNRGSVPVVTTIYSNSQAAGNRTTKANDVDWVQHDSNITCAQYITVSNNQTTLTLYPRGRGCATPFSLIVNTDGSGNLQLIKSTNQMMSRGTARQSLKGDIPGQQGYLRDVNGRGFSEMDSGEYGLPGVPGSAPEEWGQGMQGQQGMRAQNVRGTTMRNKQQRGMNKQRNTNKRNMNQQRNKNQQKRKTTQDQDNNR